MKKKINLSLFFSVIIFSACNKAPQTTPQTEDFTKLEQTVLNDFTNNVALNGYLNLSIAATKLNTTLDNLNTNTADPNLVAAQQPWRDMRTVWEQCEGFLFGPVEDSDYDPNIDTWPTDYVQMDSLLASSNPLQVIVRMV